MVEYAVLALQWLMQQKTSNKRPTSITASNEEDGVAKVINDYVLNELKKSKKTTITAFMHDRCLLIYPLFHCPGMTAAFQ